MMSVVEERSDAAAEAGPAPPAAAPPEPAPRACKACGAPLQPDQDWCLECGTAAPGRVPRGLPGWRAAMTTLGLTGVLVAGAVAAGYAALTDEPGPAASAGGPGTLAQVPPAATTPPATTAPPSATTTPPPTTPKAPRKVPKAASPSTGTATPSPPATTPSFTPPAPSPPPSSSSSSGASSPSGSSPSGGSSSGSPGSSAPSSPSKPSTPRPAKPRPKPSRPSPKTPAPPVLPAVATTLALPLGAGALYDPYGRASASGRPGLALDGNRSTAWFAEVPATAPAATTPGAGTTQTVATTTPATAPPTAATTTPATAPPATTSTTTPAVAQTTTDGDPVKPGQLGVGYALDLGREHILKTLTISTPAPGFGVQIYAADAATPPPDLLDSRWERLARRPNVGGTTSIRLDRGGFTYRTLLVWVTTPPPGSRRVQISELKVRAR